MEFQLNNKSCIELEDSPVLSNNADPSQQQQQKIAFIISIFCAS